MSKPIDLNENNGPRCDQCRSFCGQEHEGDDGECRRMPPVPMIDPVTDDDLSVFPIVPLHWFCGEFQRRVH